MKTNMRLRVTHHTTMAWLRAFAANLIAYGEPLPKTKKAFISAARDELRQNGELNVWNWTDNVVYHEQPSVITQSTAYIETLFGEIE